MAPKIVPALSIVLWLASASHAATLAGRVTDDAGQAVVGAMATVRQGDPIRDVTVYTDGAGAFRVADLDDGMAWTLRIRRIGWKDATAEGRGSDSALLLALERETDPALLAAQLPANRWYALLLDRVYDPTQREELVRQCTF